MAKIPTYQELAERVAFLESETARNKRFEKINTALFNVANTINLATDLDDLFLLIHKALSTIIDTTNFYIALYNRDKDSITFPYIVDTVDCAYPPVLEISKFSSLTAEVIRSGKPLLITKSGAAELRAKLVLRAPACTPAEIWLGVPLSVRGEINGVMVVQSYNNPHCFDQTDMQVMSTVAEQVALAIDRKRGEEALRKSDEKLVMYANQMEQFSLSAASMISLQDEKALFAKISQAIVDYSDFRRVLISLFKDEPPYRELIGYGGVSEELVARLRTIPLTKSWYDHVFSQGQHLGQFSYYIPHTMKLILNQAATVYGEGPAPSDPDCWHPEDNLFVRMNDENGRFIGVISVDDAKSGQKPTLETVRPLEIFASLISQIIILKQEQTKREKLEEQLRMAQKLEYIGRLAGGVAHDFNNMLGVIIGHAQIAEEQISHNHPLSDNLQEIRKAAERSAALTNQLLAFARKQTVIPKVIDLNQTIENMLKMLNRLIGENIQLLWHPGEDLWPVRIDPAQLDQILTNLCVNARDAISGIGAIVITTTNCPNGKPAADGSEDPLEDCVCITISDNGCGMSKDTLDHIFEPFYTTKDVGKGTGLGLATVYGAIRQNQGQIKAVSEPDKGTTFSIYLPRFRQEREQEQQVAKDKKAVSGQGCILLVEDEPSVLSVTEDILKLLGYSVLTANSPEKALLIAKEFLGKIDLLLTDVIMPVMNGKELSEQLSRLHPKMKCLFMSGYTADHISQHGVLERGTLFISKPFSKDLLASKIRDVLGS